MNAGSAGAVADAAEEAPRQFAAKRCSQPGGPDVQIWETRPHHFAPVKRRPRNPHERVVGHAAPVRLAGVPRKLGKISDVARTPDSRSTLAWRTAHERAASSAENPMTTLFLDDF